MQAESSNAHVQASGNDASTPDDEEQRMDVDGPVTAAGVDAAGVDAAAGDDASPGIYYNHLQRALHLLNRQGHRNFIPND